MAGELEGEVSFHARVHVARAALVDIPAAVAKLSAPDVGDAFFLEHRVHFLGPVHEEHVVRAQRAIDEELATPVTVLVLQPQQICLRAPDGG